MALNFNGIEPRNIIFNNHALKKIIYNNKIVWQKTKLPPNYQEVEYIESTGTQYIDTGFIPTENTRTIAKLYTLETGNKNWFGGVGATSNSGSYTFNSYSENAIEYIFGFGAWKIVNISNVVGKPFEVDFGKDGIIINGTNTETPQYTDFTPGSKTMTLWLRNGGNAYIKGRIYYLKMLDNDVLVRNFVPCYRKADNKPGLYDLVNKVFYTKAGTGEFNVGADVISSNNYVYGIKRKISNNHLSTWERIEDNYGIVANATHDGTPVFNEFDNLAPWSQIKSCNYDLNTKQVNAWYGDNNFKFDGTNGDVYTYIPKTYWKIYQEDDYDYVLLSDSPRTGFTEVDGFFIARYTGSLINNVLHSYSGLVPTTGKNISQFRTLANALGTNFSQLDWRYFVLQMLYLVEYADYNSQNKLGNGVMNRKNLKTLVAETSTNRAIIASSSRYYVGQIIRIGTSDGGVQVADARKITNIEAYDDGTVTGYALTFDGAAVNIAVNNFVCTMAQETGQCDSLGMKSGCLNNDGYHAVIYRGVENIFGNIWQFIDGINIKDYVAYICKDHSEYVSNKFENPYKAVGYTNCATNGNPKTLGFDTNEPFIRFPTEVGGGTSTYMCDYYWQNPGNRVALVGGTFYNGANDGLWSWDLDYTSSHAFWNFGCRTLIDNQENLIV